MSKKVEKPEVDIILDGDLPGDELSFLDWQAPDNHIDSELFPFLQWNNNAAAWEFPLEHWAGSQIDQDNETQEITHNFGQDTEPGMLVETIHIAVIAQRVAWERETEDGKREYSGVYEQGMRKRYNFLVLIKEADSSEPVIITARSFTGVYIQNAIKFHRQKVLKLASRLAKGTRFPTYMFWLPLMAGEKVWVGGEKKSEIQPPVPAYNDLAGLGQEGIIDLIKSLYIGDDLRDTINEYLFDQGQQWMNEYQQLRLTATAQSTPNEAEILPGGVLYLPDLSSKKPKDWIECALSIEGLFKHRSHASNAFAKVLREKCIQTASSSEQWEAYRTDIERRFADMMAEQEDVETERMLMAG